METIDMAAGSPIPATTETCFPLRKLPPMDAGQFRLWADLVERRTGMRLPENRQSFLVTNLGLRMRQLGFDDYQEYYDHVHSGRVGNVEWDRLLDHLTVHETRFFRQMSSVDLLEQKLLPELAARAGDQPVNIQVWSVGCSTGEEPYTIAMVIDRYLRMQSLPGFFGITASDISRSSIAIGREGCYSQQQTKGIPKEYTVYLRRTDDGNWRIRKELRQRVCFNQLNILDMGRAPIGKMDIVLCHNLLIYYERHKRLEIANTLADYLAPGGVLIFGVGELLNWDRPDIRRFNFPQTLAYQRVKNNDNGPAS